MTELSIQRNSALAGAYVSTAAAAPVAAATTAQVAATQSITTSDTVSISQEAQSLFEKSIFEEPVTPDNGGGIRPPDEPPAKPVKD